MLQLVINKKKLICDFFYNFILFIFYFVTFFLLILI